MHHSCDTASVSLLPAFKTRAEGVSEPTLGHALYDPIAEYARMGIPNKYWAPTTENNDYSVCNQWTGCCCW